MVGETLVNATGNQFYPLVDVLATDVIFQIALTLLIVAMISITLAHYKFSNWIDSRKITYINTHKAHIIKQTLFPLIGVSIMLAGTIYIQYYELFTQDIYIKLADASEY